MKNIILDTDLGNDIDDALALGMILGSDEFDLVGITTVRGDVHCRSRMTAKILTAAGRTDIPVVTGICHPTKGVAEMKVISPQRNVLTEEDTFEDMITEGAPEFIVEQCKKAPGEITVIAIGPLSNIGRAFEICPDLADTMAELVIMGGCIAKPFAECNIRVDPESAKIVFDAAPRMRAIDLGITSVCQMNRGLLDELVNKDERPLQRLLGRMTDYWLKGTGAPVPTLHDLLAVGCLLQPEIYEFRRFDVDVLLDSKPCPGVTKVTPNEDSPIQFCTTVDYKKFDDLVCGLIRKAPFCTDGSLG